MVINVVNMRKDFGAVFNFILKKLSVPLLFSFNPLDEWVAGDCP